MSVGVSVWEGKSQCVVPNESPAVDFRLAKVGLLLGVGEVAHEKGNNGAW